MVKAIDSNEVQSLGLFYLMAGLTLGELCIRWAANIVHPLSKPLPPIITDFNIGNNYVSLTVRTSRNLLYQIESSADYAFDKWDSKDKHFIGTGHKMTFKIPYNINKKQLFYRVSAKPI